MSDGDEQVDPLLVKTTGLHVRCLRQGRGQAQVDLAGPQAHEQPVPVVLHKRETDERVLGTEVLQQPRHGLPAERVQEPERHAAAGGMHVAREVLKCAGETGHGPFGGLEQVPAVTGQPDRTAGAGEQRHPEFGFQPGDRARQRGLRDTKQFGRAGEVFLAGYDDELAEPGHKGLKCGFGLVGSFMHI